MQLGQTQNVEQESGREQANQPKATPTLPKLAGVVEQQRFNDGLKLFRSIGRLEASVEHIESAFAKFPGGAPNGIEKSWGELKENVQSLVKKSLATASTPSGQFSELQSQVSTLQTSLDVIAGSIRMPSAESRVPQIGLPSGSVIAYDPEDIAGVAALNGIIKLSQDPGQVDALLERLQIQDRKEGEPLGKTLQRAFMRSAQDIKSGVPQSTPLQREGNLTTPEQRPSKKEESPILPDARGNYLPNRVKQ